MNNDSFFGILILENDSKSSFSDVIPTVIHTTAPNSEHVNKCSKDQSLDNIIDELERHEFFKGTMDPTVFIRRHGKNILLILQSPRGIFINQSKYALESLKKYGMESSDPVDTPMVEKSKLDEDSQGKAVDPTHYHGMVGTHMYLTASRPDLAFAVCMCAWYQAKPTKKHLHALRIFKYLRGTVNIGLWYPKDFSIALTAYADADHAGCQDTRRSTSGKQVEKGVVEIYFVNIAYHLAYIFNKALCGKRIEFLINKLGMRSVTPETLKLLANETEE
uniref:Reverse transcriptase Ty1/copia-type domain-containing protein n=1 Tax=Tanacetum cinerariifolium TaxID=118510 RepID=A0A6L2JKX0_TANCI|nr:hypothetical protein [Tanacetum cinerariifolium]